MKEIAKGLGFGTGLGLSLWLLGVQLDLALEFLDTKWEMSIK